jgi:hypothetical protein
MGQLDEARFDALVHAGCAACGGAALEIRSFLDRRIDVMLGDPNDDGKWVHDGEKFVDGTYGVVCVKCNHVAFADTACPRCHADGGVAKALAETSRMAVPRRCASCNETELIALALIPAKVRYSGGVAALPDPLVEYGDPGYHVVAYACESCDAAVVAKSCPLCDAPGPLRARP